MSMYAVFDNGAIVSYREIEDWPSYPQFKKDAIDDKPNGDGGPVLRPIEYVGSGPIETTSVELTRVIVTRSDVPLDDYKSTAKESVDAAAEAQRLRYITSGAGQAMTYREKYQQALLVQASPATATEEEFPLVAASVGIEADTLLDCADLIVASHAQWVEVGARIERVRLQAKRAIDLAESREQVGSIIAQIDWG